MLQSTKTLAGIHPRQRGATAKPYPLTLALRARLTKARLGNLRRLFKGYLDYKRGMPKFRADFPRLLGYIPNFEEPSTFNEKVNWRKLHQNPPHFATMTDKVLVRDYVDTVFSAPVSKRLFPPVLGIYTEPGDIPFDDLPSNMILKCTHACQYNIFFREERPVDRALAVRELRLWLTQTWQPHLCEPAYWPLKPRVVAEPLLCHSHGPSADDIKVFTFGGVPRIVRYTYGRFEDRKDLWLTADWGQPDGFAKLPKDLPEPPPFYKQMLDLAAHVSSPFDHLRVDFLTTDHDYWMNELTLYPSSGIKQFDPPTADVKLGEMWAIPQPTAAIPPSAS